LTKLNSEKVKQTAPLIGNHPNRQANKMCLLILHKRL